jgi:hypothetical protein
MTLEINKTNPDWIEATWKEDGVQVHCESYSGHPEHIQMLRDRCTEFETELTEDDLKIIKEVQEAFVMPTEEELEAQRQAQEQAEQTAKRKAQMLEGEVYTLNGADYQVSFTKDDGDGLVQVKSAFDLGLASTVIHFENGTKLSITAEEFPVFALWFVERRNNFFGV